LHTNPKQTHKENTYMSSHALNSKIESRNKNLNSMATLVAKGQQDSDAYHALD